MRKNKITIRIKDNTINLRYLFNFMRKICFILPLNVVCFVYEYDWFFKKKNTFFILTKINEHWIALATIKREGYDQFDYQSIQVIKLLKYYLLM